MDRVFYSIPTTRREWNSLLRLMEEVRFEEGLKPANVFVKYMNASLGEDLEIMSGQLFEFRDPESSDEDVPYGLIYIFDDEGKLYFSSSQSRPPDDIDQWNEEYKTAKHVIRLPRRLNEEFPLTQTKKMYDLPFEPIE